MDQDERDLRIYERLVDAVDSQVDRGRSDIQFFLVLNASVVAGVLASLQFFDKPQVAVLALAVFAGGFGIAIAGLSVSKNNKKYYHGLVAKRVLMEEKLGLTTAIPGHESADIAIFAVSPLATKSKVARILADPDNYVSPRVRRGSSTDWSQWTLRGFALFHTLAIGILANVLAGCAVAQLPCI